ncbi:MAG: hypothetical protein Q4P32_13155 [Micrococcales bacterium]|nr:hypothetical protein [Micrococcales bacterium]
MASTHGGNIVACEESFEDEIAGSRAEGEWRDDNFPRPRGAPA